MAINYELMARQREIRKQKEEEEKKKNEGVNIGNVLLGAAAGYLTAGLAPALLGSAASLAPSLGTVSSAIQGGIAGSKSKDAGEAAVSGVTIGAKPTLSEATKRIWETNNPSMTEKEATFDAEGNIKYGYKNPTYSSEKTRLTPYNVAQMKQKGDFRLESPKGQPGWSEFTLPDGTKRVWKQKPDTSKNKDQDVYKKQADKIESIKKIEESLATDPEIMKMKEGTMFKDNASGFTFKIVDKLPKLQR